MSIKCNATECKSNKEHGCILNTVEINFCDDEYRYASCSNFEESKDFKREHYEIRPISMISDYKYIIFSTTIDSITDYLDSVIDDFKSQYNEIGKISVLIDNLLHNGVEASNRYIECTIDFQNNDNDIIVNSLNSCKIYHTPKNSKLRKFSANFYKNHSKLIEYSILNSTQKRMILKELGI